MKAFAVLSFVASATSVAAAQDQVLVDSDFGLTFETPDGFEAEMVGQTPEGAVVISVGTSNPALPTFELGGDICEVSYHYDPAYGRGDQQWVNSLFDNTDAYERMALEVEVPGTIEGGEDFSHRGSSSHRVHGQHDLGGAFSVTTIPSPMGYVMLNCVSSAAEVDWSDIDPVIAGITAPGQNRDHLIATGSCDADTDALVRLIGNGPLDATTIATLDGGREAIVDSCGGLHADALMDEVMTAAGLDGSYRDLRYDAIAQLGSDLLTDEQHVALDGGRDQMVVGNDEATGDRYVKYMHFIVGLRSLD